MNRIYISYIYLIVYLPQTIIVAPPQHLHSAPSLVDPYSENGQNKSILNFRLQRDLSMFGRTPLSKAESLSHFVHPSLSLFINNKSLKYIYFLIWTLSGQINLTHLRRCSLIAKPRNVYITFSHFSRDIPEASRVNATAGNRSGNLIASPIP